MVASQAMINVFLPLLLGGSDDMQPNEDDAKEAAALLEKQPWLRRFTELAGPATAGGSLTSIGCILWAISLNCVEQVTYRNVM